MAAAKNNFTAPDSYDGTGLIPCPNSGRVRMFVNNQSVYWRRGFQVPGGAGVRWEAEEFLIPGIYSFNDRCDMVEVRAALTLAEVEALEGEQQQAQITIATRTLDELTQVKGRANDSVSGP